MDKSSAGKLYIKKRTVSEWMMLFIFFFPAAQAFLTELLPIPDAIKFLCDVFLVLLLLKLFSQRLTKIDNYSMPFVVIVGLFFFITLVGYLFNYQSVFYYLWGLRNNIRMFVAFFAFAYLADWEDAKGWIKALDVLFVINFAVVILQYFSGYGQDYIGGIFGTSKGCNGSLLIFLCIVFAKTILSFMRGEEKMSKCIFVSVASLLVSTLSELKMFFILFILILFMASFMTAHSIKKTLFFAFGAVLVVLFGTLRQLVAQYVQYAVFRISSNGSLFVFFVCIFVLGNRLCRTGIVCFVFRRFVFRFKKAEKAGNGRRICLSDEHYTFGDKPDTFGLQFLFAHGDRIYAVLCFGIADYFRQ